MYGHCYHKMIRCKYVPICTKSVLLRIFQKKEGKEWEHVNYFCDQTVRKYYIQTKVMEIWKFEKAVLKNYKRSEGPWNEDFNTFFNFYHYKKNQKMSKTQKSFILLKYAFSMEIMILIKCAKCAVIDNMQMGHKWSTMTILGSTSDISVMGTFNIIRVQTYHWLVVYVGISRQSRQDSVRHRHRTDFCLYTDLPHITHAQVDTNLHGKQWQIETP